MKLGNRSSDWGILLKNGPGGSVENPRISSDPQLGLLLFALMMAMVFAPKLATLLAVPIATITAEPRLGSLPGRLVFWRIPEETFPSADLRALQLPTLHPARLAPAPTDTLAEAASRQ
jgi:hypothetical protein